VAPGSARRERSEEHGRGNRRAHRGSGAPASAPRPLLDLLVELVLGLEQVQDDPGVIDCGGPPQRWDGDGYTYFEVELPRMLASEIDINVHAGRVFIRLGRIE
jgi:hypothetical protein